MNSETIHIENLSIGYPGKNDVKVVADGICAGINSGELTCLLGANGVGKSTLLRTLSAFQPKLGGEIRIQGREIETYTDKQLSRVISVVLTEKCDLRNMSVTELVGLGRTPYTGFWRVDTGGQACGGTLHCFGRHPSPGTPHGAYVERRRTSESDDSQSAGSGDAGDLSG